MIATTEAVTEPEVATEKYIFTDEEKNMLCFMSDTEGKDSVESRQACMQVAINRIYSDKFKQDAIRGVLFTLKQFQTMRRYYAGYEPTGEAIEALSRILMGDDIFGGETPLYFAATWISPAKIMGKLAYQLYFIKEIGGNRFYGQN